MFKLILLYLTLLLTYSNNSSAGAPSEELDKLLIEHKGSVVYVDLWASWCGPCRKSFPWMNAMQKKHNNLKIVSINLDQNKELATEFLTDNPVNFSIIYDPKGTLAKKYKLQGMPSSYIYNKAGKLVASHAGFTETKKNQYETELQTLLVE
jgi:thiol-disulfide isomerase/thioredoxin